MCGIAGIVHLDSARVPQLLGKLRAMNQIQQHRGPDGQGVWTHDHGHVGVAHRRLSIIDVATGSQPMVSARGDVLTFNGEIYNYKELRRELGEDRFTTMSDTEVLLVAYEEWGDSCVDHFRGMFAFMLYDAQNDRVFCARDRTGIKPLYYTVENQVLYVASEAKTLLPFVPAIETDPESLKEYLYFQFCLEGKTLFKHITELPPAHTLTVNQGVVSTRRYWQLNFNLDFDHTERYFIDRMEELCEDSTRIHTRADVPLGAYISGGLDSTAVAALAGSYLDQPLMGFIGKFTEYPGFDESAHAREFAKMHGITLHEHEITSHDFISQIAKVIYHLDYPVAGPGAFSQYVISGHAAKHRKVVLGGQGGDEIFGGYVRYLMAYFEQCIKGAIDGTLDNGNFILTYDSIIPFLPALKEYKPLLKTFWASGLFDSMDERYFRLINRSPNIGDEVRWHELPDYDPFTTFARYYGATHIKGESYLNRMLHFDFKTLLPALLQVEDRVSMAHGLESRVPLLDHPIIELAASVPPSIKFKEGVRKYLLRSVVKDRLPRSVVDRSDKMGFPLPLTQWLKGPLKEFVRDTFSSKRAQQRQYIDVSKVVKLADNESSFGRTVWGYLSLELWEQSFHDQQREFKRYVEEGESVVEEQVDVFRV